MTDITTYGPGDECTWSAPAGHPHDPRIPSKGMRDEVEVIERMQPWQARDFVHSFWLAAQLLGDEREAAIDLLLAKLEDMR